tara:strand:+ start:727 stop:1443 length:717 start_codon:yes stop_codon:yes gene_type:complete
MIHFITYADNKFKLAKERLYNEALNTKWFDTVTSYGPEDLDDLFKKKFKNILNQGRGGGYWIWKLYVIHKKLSEINSDDVLIYLDAGCSINIKGENRFREYIKMLEDRSEGIISFQMTHLPEKLYTVKEIFEYFNVEINGEIANSGQIMATINIMKKNSNSLHIVNTWLHALESNSSLFTDEYNKNQKPYFRDNRHDQSVFSVLRKLNNTILLKDETYFPFGNKESLKYPFWATRRRN